MASEAVPSSEAESPVDASTRSSLGFVAAGIALIALCLALTALSGSFEYGGDPRERPTPLMVAMLMTAGAVYLVASALIHRLRTSRVWLLFVLSVGLLMRISMLPSTPMLEDDFYRYLWDGGVVARGYNPYAFAPGEVAYYGLPEEVPEALRDAVEDSGVVMERINHPSLGTVYPPVAQGAFALAHAIKPWSLGALRAVLLFFDIATCVVLLLILKHSARPLLYCAIYWWNPLAVLVIVNSAHMDPIILPFLLGAVYWASRQKRILSTVALAIAACVKIWPIILAPLLFRYFRASRKELVVVSTIGVVLVVGLSIPMLAGLRQGDDSGFVAYGKEWEMNDALFMGFLKAGEVVEKALGREETDFADVFARGAVAGVLMLWIAWLCRRRAENSDQLFDRITLAVAALFMLSPTQFPWYYLWILPLLALSPRPSLLVLTLMLPLYYLKFYYVAHGEADFFHHRVVWIEYAPTFALLIWEAFRARKRGAGSGGV